MGLAGLKSRCCQGCIKPGAPGLRPLPFPASVGDLHPRAHGFALPCWKPTVWPSDQPSVTGMQGLGSMVWPIAPRCRLSPCRVASVVEALAQSLRGMRDRSPPPRDRTCVPCTTRQVLNPWITREAPPFSILKSPCDYIVLIWIIQDNSILRLVGDPAWLPFSLWLEVILSPWG